MHLLHTVSGALAVHVVADHHASGAAPLAGAGDVQMLDFGELAHVELLADGNAVDSDAEFADEPLKPAIGFGRESRQFALARPLKPLAVELGNVIHVHCGTSQAPGLVEKARSVPSLVSVPDPWYA